MQTTRDMQTTTDGWDHFDAKFVGPDEWLAGVGGKSHLLTRQTLIEALAAAADTEGRLLDFNIVDFYEGPLSDVMRNQDDGPDWKLSYDRFTAMALMEMMLDMVSEGLLAHRGNGGSFDRRLSLPR